MKMTRTLQLCLAGAMILAGAFPATDLAADDKEPAPSFQRVLFLGNSITRHGPKADIGWSGNWGMAASEEAKDYVHLVSEDLSALAKTPCETMVQNIAGFEREYATYDLAPLLEEVRQFQPDLVVLAIGENVPKLETPEAEKSFVDSVEKLLAGVRGEEKPTFIVRSSFWANEAKDRALRQVCDGVGGTFVDIGHLGKDESNYARSERDFEHKGVAAHPGDKGMRAIADAILAAAKKKANPAG